VPQRSPSSEKGPVDASSTQEQMAVDVRPRARLANVLQVARADRQSRVGM
jgi:hypothetical protein